MYSRIRVTGPVGGGKTYFGKKLSGLTGIPLTQIDKLRWKTEDNDYTQELPFKEKVAQLDKVTKRKKWIFEGVVEKKWTHISFDRADIIFVIKPSRLKRVFNLTRRTFFTKRNKRDNFLKLLRWTWKWDKKEALSPYSEKIVVFSSGDKALKWCKKNF